MRVSSVLPLMSVEAYSIVVVPSAVTRTGPAYVAIDAVEHDVGAHQAGGVLKDAQGHVDRALDPGRPARRLR